MYASGVYNPLLVLISLLIAICASYTSLELIRRVASSSGKAAKVWMFAGAFSMGTGIWSMHFVGMLAYSMSMPYEYDAVITIVSLIVGIVASLFAIYIGSYKTMTAGRLVLSGLVLGVGIVSMHYTGMAAMKMDATAVYDPLLFSLSVLVAIVAATAALWIAGKTRNTASRQLLLGAAVVMGIAICGMHYIGMFAIKYLPADHALMATDNLSVIQAGSNNWLAVAVILSTIVIIAFTHLTIFFDYKLGQQKDMQEKLSIRVAERTAELQRQTDDLRASKENLSAEIAVREAAQDETARMGEILDGTFNEIYIFDINTLKFTNTNKGARANLGYSVEELKNMTPMDLHPQVSKEDVFNAISPLQRGEKESLLLQNFNRRKDGSVYPVEIRATDLLGRRRAGLCGHN